jgi:hypothetical protein
MSRRVSATLTGLATVYCCDGCGDLVTRAEAGAPQGWRAAWASHPAEAVALRMARFDLCEVCGVATSWQISQTGISAGAAAA